MKIDGDNYHVYFFGSNHERAIIGSSHVLPISTDPQTLVVNIPSFSGISLKLVLQFYPYEYFEMEILGEKNCYLVGSN